MALFGKSKAGAGSAVLDALEESYGSELPVREPAPAGTLRRGRLAEAPEPGFSRVEEEMYRPRHERVKHGLSLGLPKSASGKIIAAVVAVLGLGAVVVAMLGARSFLLHDLRFAVATSSEIQITGNRHLTREQILSVFGADLERNIFKVPLAERRADLERLPWVAHATVMRLLPNHLRIAVTERTPVAFVRQGTQIGLVDANGVLLDMPEDAAGDPHYSFPVLTGLSESDPLSTRAARVALYRRFMQELDSGGANGAGQRPTQSLSEVDVSDPEDVKALIASGGSDILVHFGEEDFLDRYRLFEQNLPQWKAQYPKLASVDTRYEHQMVLEMQPDAAAAPAAGGDAGTNSMGAATAAPATGAVPANAVPAKAASAKASPVKPAARAHAAAKEKHAVSSAKTAKQKVAAELAAARRSSLSVTDPQAAGK